MFQLPFVGCMLEQHPLDGCQPELTSKSRLSNFYHVYYVYWKFMISCLTRTTCTTYSYTLISVKLATSATKLEMQRTFSFLCVCVCVLSLSLSLSVCVCACVCVPERWGGPLLLCPAALQWNSCAGLQQPPPNKARAAWQLPSHWPAFLPLEPITRAGWWGSEWWGGGEKHNREDEDWGRAERSVRKFCHEEHTKRFWLTFPLGADKIETTESEGGPATLNGGQSERF